MSLNRAYDSSQNRAYVSSQNRAFNKMVDDVPALLASFESRNYTDDSYELWTDVVLFSSGSFPDAAQVISFKNGIWTHDGMSRLLSMWLDGTAHGSGVAQGAIDEDGGVFSRAQADSVSSRDWIFRPQEGGDDWVSDDLEQSGQSGTVTVSTGTFLGQSMGTDKVGFQILNTYGDGGSTIIASGNKYPPGYCLFMPVDDGSGAPMILATTSGPYDEFGSLITGDLAFDVVKMIVTTYFALKVAS